MAPRHVAALCRGLEWGDVTDVVDRFCFAFGLPSPLSYEASSIAPLANGVLAEEATVAAPDRIAATVAEIGDKLGVIRAGFEP